MTMEPSLLLMAKSFLKMSNSKPPARPNTTKRRRPPTSKSKNLKNITTKNLLSINLRPSQRIQMSRMMKIILPKASLEPKKLKVLKLNKKKMRERKL